MDFNQFPAQLVELPAFTTVNLSTEIDVVRGGPGRPTLSGVLRIENLFNERYEQVVGFEGRERAVFGGAKFRF